MRGRRSGEKPGHRAEKSPEAPRTPWIPPFTPPPPEARRARPHCSPSGNTPQGRRQRRESTAGRAARPPHRGYRGGNVAPKKSPKGRPELLSTPRPPTPRGMASPEDFLFPFWMWRFSLWAAGLQDARASLGAGGERRGRSGTLRATLGPSRPADAVGGEGAGGELAGQQELVQGRCSPGSPGRRRARTGTTSGGPRPGTRRRRPTAGR